MLSVRGCEGQEGMQGRGSQREVACLRRRRGAPLRPSPVMALLPAVPLARYLRSDSPLFAFAKGRKDRHRGMFDRSRSRSRIVIRGAGTDGGSRQEISTRGDTTGPARGRAREWRIVRLERASPGYE